MRKPFIYLHIGAVVLIFLGITVLLHVTPWGRICTFTGFGLLALCLLRQLSDPKGSFRKMLLLLWIFPSLLYAAPMTVTRAEAEDFGRLHILYLGRPALFDTFARDFTRKLTGRDSYCGYTAAQVALGFILHPDEWSAEPVIRVEDKTAMKDRYGFGEMVSAAEVLRHPGCAADPFFSERIGLIQDLQAGDLLRMFPQKGSLGVVWLAPTDDLSGAAIPEADLLFLKNYFALLSWQHERGDAGAVSGLIAGLEERQREQGGQVLPSRLSDRFEELHNTVPFVRILVVLNLSAGLLLAVAGLFVRGESLLFSRKRKVRALTVAILFASFVLLTLLECIRWVVGGHVPIAGVLETLLFMAWAVQAVALLFGQKRTELPGMSLLLAGFMLLVTQVTGMDDAITPVLPILDTPWLPIHVSLVMMSYTLYAFTFAAALAALFGRNPWRSRVLRRSSLLMLYPANFFLLLGIFTGSIWAESAWGAFWSWDPKETWALITLLVYAPATHSASLKQMRRPLFFHIYVACAFGILLVTYFGVNYFFGGLHSYSS